MTRIFFRQYTISQLFFNTISYLVKYHAGYTNRWRVNLFNEIPPNNQIFRKRLSKCIARIPRSTKQFKKKHNEVENENY